VAWRGVAWRGGVVVLWLWCLLSWGGAVAVVVWCGMFGAVAVQGLGSPPHRHSDPSDWNGTARTCFRFGGRDCPTNLRHRFTRDFACGSEKGQGPRLQSPVRPPLLSLLVSRAWVGGLVWAGA
jgi:hypothetical protein